MVRTSYIKGVKKVTASLLIAGLVSVLTVGVAIAHGTVDQINPLPSSSRWASPGEPWVWGQTFIPQESNIISVDLVGHNRNENSQHARSITVSIRESSGNPEFSGKILGSVTQTVSLPALEMETIHFDFPETIPLVLGNTYVIEVKAPASGWITFMRSVDVDSYSGGMVKKHNIGTNVTTEYPQSDFGFTTYYELNYNKNDIKKNGGNPGKGMEKAPGLQKPFSENSNAGDNVARKNEK